MMISLAVLLSAHAYAANPSCLSSAAVEGYSKNPSVEKMSHSPKPVVKKKGLSLQYVREALEKNQLVTPDPSPLLGYERGGEDDQLKPGSDYYGGVAQDTATIRALNARDSSQWLERNGFVNLAHCEAWKTKLSDPAKVPEGAVVVYRHPRDDMHPGHIEIATASGFWSDRPRAKREYAPGLQVTGVFVRPDKIRP